MAEIAEIPKLDIINDDVTSNNPNKNKAKKNIFKKARL